MPIKPGKPCKLTISEKLEGDVWRRIYFQTGTEARVQIRHQLEYPCWIQQWSYVVKKLRQEQQHG